VRSFLDRYNKRVKPELCKEVTLDSVLYAINHSGNTAPGPDGIPFAAWRAAPDLAAPVLLKVFRAISSGQPPPSGFNNGLLFLLPKKKTGLVSDTRPLSVTNTDNRLIAATVAHSIMPAMLDLVDPSQKGFLNGRQGADHVVDVNRFFYEGLESGSKRYLFLLDTAKAFDSVDHDWVRAVIDKVGFPPWFSRFVRGSLNNVKVSPFFGSDSGVWIDIDRGVKQGCPLSPLLFLLAFDPLLNELRRLPNLRTFAFADDLAIATSDDIKHIYPALSLISSFSEVSGLGINKDKSIVLTTSPPSCHSAIRSALLRSPWPDLPLRDRGTHLGVSIGSDVTLEDIWAGPMATAISRLNKARPFLRSLSIANRITYVNVFITSVFSYIGLFFILPTDNWTVIKGHI
jgi:hypothetical protein